jgi:hypothetical protein
VDGEKPYVEEINLRREKEVKYSEILWNCNAKQGYNDKNLIFIF